MTTTTATYSFVTQKSSKTEVQLLQTPPSSSSSTGIKFKILHTSLSANNKFYLDFGEKPPFNFFNCYPVAEEATLVDDASLKNVSTTFVHPSVWGLCEVMESHMDEVKTGTVYRAMLPMGTEVAFDKATVNERGELVVHRPTTNPGYNVFTPVPKDSVCHPDSLYSGLALVCGPGYVTGFGLYFAMERGGYYGGCDTIVLTSASSKVALSLALYLKHKGDSKKTVIGYTSPSNKEFCESTGLYSSVLTYDEDLPEDMKDVIMIDISGQAAAYKKNEQKVKKLLVIGNASGTADKDTTFAAFSTYATIKMMLTMMGGPKWLRQQMNPKQELFLIMDTAQELLTEWGKEKYDQTVEEYCKLFCEQAMSQWGMATRHCETEESIQTAFQDIVQGKVPPTECIVMDVAKAVAHRP